MAEQLPETTHFGFTRVGSGETVSKNGYSALDLDRLKLDALLYAAFNHRHDGGNALGDPTDGPSLTPQPSGGHLPASTTFYYRIAYVDQYGLETSASPETSQTTPDPIAPPTPPGATITTTGGAVTPGIYSYMITYTDSYGGETTPSALNNVQVTGGTHNTIALAIADPPSIDAVGCNVYRARPGQSSFYLIGAVTIPSIGGATFTDTLIIEDQTITAPTVNTSNAANAMIVTVPGAFIPPGCASWKIYRATASGAYDGNSLVHHVTEGATSTNPIPVTLWTDTGDTLLQGFPLNTSATVPGGQTLALNEIAGKLHLDVLPRGSQVLNAFAPGTLSTDQVLTKTETPNDVTPVRFSAYFQTAPSSSVTLRLQDNASHSIDLVCGSGSNYALLELPLIQSDVFYAANGTRSDPTVVGIDDDVTATTGLAVTLDAYNEWVQVDLGTLDPGSYHTSALIRIVTYASPGSDTIQSDIIRTDTNASVNTVTITPGDGTDTTYQEYALNNFTAIGGVPYALRLTKIETSGQIYNIDWMSFHADVTTLFKGPLTLKVSGSGSGADVNVTAWL